MVKRKRKSRLIASAQHDYERAKIAYDSQVRQNEVLRKADEDMLAQEKILIDEELKKKKKKIQAAKEAKIKALREKLKKKRRYDD